MQNACDAFNQRLRDGGGNVFQRQVGRYEGDAQAFAGKHHHDLPRAAFFRQIFGVSAEKTCACARVVDDAFVQRRGNDAVENAV